MRWTTMTTKAKATVVVTVAALLWIGGVGTAGAVVGAVVNAPPPAQVVAAAAAPRTAEPTPTTTPTPTPTPVVTVSEVQETAPIPFEKTTVDDPALGKGQTRVTTAGVDGVTTTTFRVTTTDGVETGRELVRTETTTPAVTEVTAVGSYVAPAPAPAPAVQQAPAPQTAVPPAQTGTIVPGAYCSSAQSGAVQQAANGRSYQCGGKGPDANGRLHWNTM